jgi:Uncharacterized protein conserved in bacteria (DUF2213)
MQEYDQDQRNAMCYSQFRRKHNVVALSSYQTQRKMFEGRLHIVAPVILLTEGVHAGSAGPIYYPDDELRKYPATWNGIPIPILHPHDNDGDPVSCNSPEVLERSSIGRLFNVIYSDGKLRGEIWVDEDKCSRLAPAVMSDLRARKPIEVSTGLFSDDDQTPGEWNGEVYSVIARNLRPDHLALLPGQVGACSIQDGCGVRANKEGGDDVEVNVAKRADVNPARGTTEYGNVTFADEKNHKYPIDTEAHIRAAWNYINKTKNAAKYSSDDVSTIKGKIVAAWKRKIDPAGPSSVVNNEVLPELMGLAEILFNEMGYNDIADVVGKLVDKMDQRNPDGSPKVMNYVKDIFGDCFVFAQETQEGRKLFKQSYSIDNNNAVVLDGDPKEVRKEVNYIEVLKTNIEKEAKTMPEEVKKCCPKKVQALIDNAVTPYTIEDREWLEGLTPEALTALEGKTYHPAPKEAPKTQAEVIAAIPEAMRTEIEAGLKLQQETKDAVVKTILANELNQFTEDELKAKGVDELRKLTAVMRIPDYSAQGSADLKNHQITDNAGAGEVLPLPTMDFGKKKE